MDIKIKRVYYTLKLLDGLWYIFSREEVSPSQTVSQLGLCFDSQADANECVKKLNESNEDGSH